MIFLKYLFIATVLAVGANSEYLDDLLVEEPLPEDPCLVQEIFVKNFELKRTETGLRAEWSPPNVKEACVLNYEVIVENKRIIKETYETEKLFFEYEADLVPCLTTTVTVTPVSSTGNRGIPLVMSNTPAITELGHIENLQYTEDSVFWEKPATAGECLIMYNVIINDDYNQFKTVTTRTAIEHRLVPCLPVQIVVIPIYYVSRKITGVPVTIETVGPKSGVSPPIHVKTDPQRNAAVITLKANLNETNACVITHANFRCARGGLGQTFTFSVTDNPERVFTLTVNLPFQDSVYICTATWTIGNNFTTGNSEEFSFRTRPLQTKKLNISKVTPTSFEVNWREDYDPDFVLGYTVVAQSFGPVHFVPESCNIERNFTHRFNVAANASNFTFLSGFPNYNYTVTLETNYDLGSIEAVSYASHAQTLQSAPGSPESLRNNWTYEPGKRYNVSGIVTWGVPCDVNGFLQRFELDLTTHFQIGGSILDFPQSFTIQRNVSETGNYTFIWNDANPFYTYDVSVRTIAYGQGRAAQISPIPPPACNCI